MREIIEFIIDNKDFLFGGIGLFIIGGLFKLLTSNKKNKSIPNSEIKKQNTINVNKSKMKAERDIKITGGDSYKIDKK